MYRLFGLFSLSRRRRPRSVAQKRTFVLTCGKARMSTDDKMSVRGTGGDRVINPSQTYIPNFFVWSDIMTKFMEEGEIVPDLVKQRVAKLTES